MQETSEYYLKCETDMLYATKLLAEILHWHKTDGSVGKLSQIMDDVDDYLNEVKSDISNI